MTSDIGRLVLALHEKAKEEGRILIEDEYGELLLAVIENPNGWAAREGPRHDAIKPYIEVGCELSSGVVRSDLAKQIRRKALRALADYDTLLWCIDTIGYRPILLRSALVWHYKKLAQSPIGSDGHIVLTDIRSAVEKAPADIIQTAQMLAAGLSVQKISELTGENGSRLAHRTLGWISRRLERNHKI